MPGGTRLRLTNTTNSCGLPRTAAAIPMMLAYGHQIAPEGDIYVTIADTALKSLARAGIHGTYVVDYLSFCE